MKDFIDFLKLPPNILGALSIASGTLLLLPQKLCVLSSGWLSGS